MSFENLGIPQDIMRSINEQGFTEPTDIQRKTIPLILEGKDVIAGSATGSGKTLAFGVGLIEGTTRGKGLQTLVLTPTRELAEQIMTALKFYSKHKQLHVIAVYGGVSINPQFSALKKADIVVGTPGRILDHMERGTIDLRKVRFMVLDEADRMLDMGFFDDVNHIMSKCPREKQTMLFSATVPPEVEHLSKRFMHNPIKVKSDNYVDPRKLHQIYYNVRRNMKFSLLLHLLQQEKSGLVMVFSNSRKYVDIISKSLYKQGIDAMGIHGGLTQAKRSAVLKKFNSKKAFVLVCTDVAARGLDIPGVSHVYNYDIANDPKQYVHRIGRTARAGESGIAISLISDADHENFARVQREFDVNITRVEKPYVRNVEMSMPRRQSFQRKSFRPRHTRSR